MSPIISITPFGSLIGFTSNLIEAGMMFESYTVVLLTSLSPVVFATINLLTTFTASQIPLYVGIPFVIYAVPTLTNLVVPKTFKTLTLITHAVDAMVPGVNTTEFADEYIKPLYLKKWSTGLTFPTIYKMLFPMCVAFLPISNKKIISKMTLSATSVLIKIDWSHPFTIDLPSNLFAQSGKNAASFLCSASPVDHIPYIGAVICTSLAGATKDILLVTVDQKNFDSMDFMLNIPKSIMKETHKYAEKLVGGFVKIPTLEGVERFVVTCLIPRGFLTKGAEEITKFSLEIFWTKQTEQGSAKRKVIEETAASTEEGVVEDVKIERQYVNNLDQESLSQSICGRDALVPYKSPSFESVSKKSSYNNKSSQAFDLPNLTEKIVSSLLLGEFDLDPTILFQSEQLLGLKPCLLYGKHAASIHLEEGVM